MLMRPLWLLVGLTATGTGIAGIVLPLLPTTPFLLLAAFAFARSSPGLHDWLLRHPTLGRVIEDWRRYGAVSRRAKWAAFIVMAAGLLCSLWLGVPAWVVLLQLAIFTAVGVFLVTRPDAVSGRG